MTRARKTDVLFQWARDEQLSFECVSLHNVVIRPILSYSSLLNRFSGRAPV